MRNVAPADVQQPVSPHPVVVHPVVMQSPVDSWNDKKSDPSGGTSPNSIDCYRAINGGCKLNVSHSRKDTNSDILVQMTKGGSVCLVDKSGSYE